MKGASKRKEEDNQEETKLSALLPRGDSRRTCQELPQNLISSCCEAYQPWPFYDRILPETRRFVPDPCFRDQSVRKSLQFEGFFLLFLPWIMPLVYSIFPPAICRQEKVDDEQPRALCDKFLLEKLTEMLESCYNDTFFVVFSH